MLHVKFQDFDNPAVGGVARDNNWPVDAGGHSCTACLEVQAGVEVCVCLIVALHTQHFENGFEVTFEYDRTRNPLRIHRVMSARNGIGGFFAQICLSGGLRRKGECVRVSCRLLLGFHMVAVNQAEQGKAHHAETNGWCGNWIFHHGGKLYRNAPYNSRDLVPG